MTPLYQQYMQSVPSMPLMMNLQAAMAQARQIMSGMQNPQQFVFNTFHNIPPQIQNNPDQIIQYLRQNNMLSPQQLQVIRMAQGGFR